MLLIRYYVGHIVMLRRCAYRSSCRTSNKCHSFFHHYLTNLHHIKLYVLKSITFDLLITNLATLRLLFWGANNWVVNYFIPYTSGNSTVLSLIVVIREGTFIYLLIYAIIIILHLKSSDIISLAAICLVNL